MYDATTALMIALASAVLVGRLDEGQAIADEIEPLLRFGNEAAGQLAIAVRAMIGVMRSGDVREYARTCEGVLEVALPATSIGFCLVWLAAAEFWSGRWGEAEEHLTQSVEGDAGFIALMQAGGLLKLRAYSGAGEEALSIWRARRSDLPALGRPIDGSACVMLVAAIEGLALLRRNDEVAELYPFVVEAVATGTLFDMGSGLLQRVAGIAAGCDRQWAAAEQHFEKALRQAHEIPHRIEQPEVRRWYASTLLDRDAPGDRERARELLNKAIAMYGEIGMPKHVEMSDALLTKASGKT